jgi:glutamine synthetase
MPVERGLRSALARIEASHPAVFDERNWSKANHGASNEVSKSKEKPPRNEHRREKPDAKAYLLKLACLTADADPDRVGEERE